MSKKMEKLISREVFYVDTLHVAKYEKIMARICVSDVRNISFLLIKLSILKQTITCEANYKPAFIKKCFQFKIKGEYLRQITY